jgi:hypothetical protein
VCADRHRTHDHKSLLAPVLSLAFAAIAAAPREGRSQVNAFLPAAGGATVASKDLAVAANFAYVDARTDGTAGMEDQGLQDRTFLLRYASVIYPRTIAAPVSFATAAT